MMSKKMGIYKQDKLVGRIGENTGVTDRFETAEVHVGDIVMYNRRHMNHIGVVINDDGIYRVMGRNFLLTDLGQHMGRDLQIVVKHSDVSQEILQAIGDGTGTVKTDVFIKEIEEVEEMTLEEIEKELGRKIKIVREKKSFQDTLWDEYWLKNGWRKKNSKDDYS